MTDSAMTQEQAFNLGYDMASKTDYESSQRYFRNCVLNDYQFTVSKIPNSVYPDMIKGINANWEDCVFNGARVLEDI